MTTTVDHGSNGKPRLAVVVPLPTTRTLHETHREHLHALGLTDETIELAQLYTERHKAIAELLHRRSFPRHHGAAMVFPLFTPGATEPYAYRVRPDSPRTNKRGKKIKYEQAEGAGLVLVYFPPRACRSGAYRDATTRLVWTEGEKKGLVLDQIGATSIALTGVWNWLDSPHRDETGEWRLHPLIREHVDIAGREHVICFDHDANDNEQVMHAAQRLAGALRASGAASIKFITPPTREQKGIDDFYAAFGEQPTLALLDAAGPIEPLDVSSPCVRAKSVRALRDAPIHDELRLPEGYEIRKDGTLWKLAADDKHSDVKITSSPILIVRHLEDHQTGDARVDITFRRDDEWKQLCVNRRALADARTMVAELAGIGVPVTSNSAPKIVDWLEALEHCNEGLIERVRTVSRTGWHTHTIDKTRFFVLDTPISTSADTRSVTLDTRGDRRKMFAALTGRGLSLQKHLELLRRAWAADPTCAAMICGALAATLLEPLGAPNFAIHLPGDSSRGKTSMLKIAASVFGDPNNEQWLGNWNTTGVASELRAATLCDLPQLYDEVGSGDASTLERSVYMLVNGSGRARGKADLSVRGTPGWRTVVLSTGERELVDEGASTGAQVRVIHFPVSKFGDLKAPEVDALREACIAESGMFGRAWVENLLTIDDWSQFRELLRVVTKRLRAAAEKNQNPLQARVAGYFATLQTTEVVAHTLGLGDEFGATMETLFNDTERRAMVQPLADRALDLVRDWTMQEADAFPNLGDDDTPKHSYGKTRHGFRRGTDEVLLIPAAARAFFDDHKLSLTTVAREWRQNKWLDCDSERLTKNTRITGQVTQHLYVLDLAKRDADLAKRDAEAKRAAEEIGVKP